MAFAVCERHLRDPQIPLLFVKAKFSEDDPKVKVGDIGLCNGCTLHDPEEAQITNVRVLGETHKYYNFTITPVTPSDKPSVPPTASPPAQ